LERLSGPATLGYDMTAAQVESALEAALGFSAGGIEVTESRTSSDVSYNVSFVGAHAGTRFDQLSWIRRWTMTATNPGVDGSYQLTVPGRGTVTMNTSDSGTTVQAVLSQLYGLACITVVRVSAGVYRVTFGGPSLVLDLGQRQGAAAVPATQLQPSLDGSARVDSGSVREGTTSPTHNTVQRITVNASGGTYVLHFVLPNGGGVPQDISTGPIAYNASAADLLSALDAIMNPNNVNPNLPFTFNVGVEQHGGVYYITYLGQDQLGSIGYIDTRNLNGTAA